MSIFKECADIQTADMLKLPVPEAAYENVVLKPSEYQKDIVQSLAERAEAVRNNLVEPSEDNMLKITNDGRKLALDQRLVNAMLPDNEIQRRPPVWKKLSRYGKAQKKRNPHNCQERAGPFFIRLYAENGCRDQRPGQADCPPSFGHTLAPGGGGTC